ncbi:MAG: anthranilate phosphoribosyltransferase [Bryobacteraceae bacterium]|nr:anthranilate phosphoribosyltransferase [Bryobacteraceae bacterium]
MALDDELSILLRGHSLGRATARAAMERILAGTESAAQITGLLVALRIKGETAEELAGFTEAMRAHLIPVHCDAQPLLDTCGTGGDGLGTFNISTVVALVVAGAGAVVAKHGNRSFSSQTGSADVLEALGVRVGLTAEENERCLREAGVAFLFAPQHHPAVRHVQALRRELKLRTVFNFLGPLSNPASAPYQLVGAPSYAVAKMMAQALALLGTRRSLVVHGADGLDEISLSGLSWAFEVHDGQVKEHMLKPDDFGVSEAPLSALAGGDAAVNAALALEILQGAAGPRREIVRINAAAALVACGLAENYRDGAWRAAQSIDSGAALAKLEALRKATA